MNRVWRSLPRRQRVLLKVNLLMWSHFALVAALQIFHAIVDTPASQLVFAIGVLLSTGRIARHAFRLAAVAQRRSSPYRKPAGNAEA